MRMEEGAFVWMLTADAAGGRTGHGRALHPRLRAWKWIRAGMPCGRRGAMRGALPCNHDPFSQKIWPQRSRKSVRMPAGREPCDAHPRLSLSVQVRLANFARPARIHLDRGTDRPEPELPSRIPNEPEGRRKPHDCDAPGRTNPTPMRPWCPRSPARPAPVGFPGTDFHGPMDDPNERLRDNG